MEAAQIAAQSFAEGFFGAPATLGAGPAAGRSLSSVNAWLFSQSRRDPERLGMAASLSALTFGASKKIGASTLAIVASIANVGARSRR